MTHGQIGVIKGHVGPRVLKRCRTQGVPDVVFDVERFNVGLDADAVAVAVALRVIVIDIAVVVVEGGAMVVGEVFAAGVKGVVRIFEVEGKSGIDLTALQEESCRGEISRVFFYDIRVGEERETRGRRKNGDEEEEKEKWFWLVRC